MPDNMPRKDHERLSGAKKGVEESSTQEIPPVETWIKPAIEIWRECGDSGNLDRACKRHHWRECGGSGNVDSAGKKDDPGAIRVQY
jgi:hypothetical protein